MIEADFQRITLGFNSDAMLLHQADEHIGLSAEMADRHQDHQDLTFVFQNDRRMCCAHNR